MTTARDVVRGGTSVPLEVQTYGRIPNVLDIPSLIKIQLDNFDWFKREGLRELLNEISPIQDFTGSKMDLVFGDSLIRSSTSTKRGAEKVMSRSRHSSCECLGSRNS